MSNLTVSQIDALCQVKEIPELRLFFFRKISGLKWFDDLQRMGFFDASENPPPNKSNEESFIVPSWPVLAYLEKVAPEFDRHENRRYAKECVDVIRKVTKYAIRKRFSNHRTWWCFSKILRYIPNDLLAESDAGLIAYWARDPFKWSLVREEIGRKFLPKLLRDDETRSHRIALKLFKVITSIRLASEAEPSFSTIDVYHARNIFNENAQLIGEKTGRSGVLILQRQLKKVIAAGGMKNSTMWRPAIENDKQNIGLDSELHVLLDAFRDALCGYINARATDATAYLDKLLSSNVELIRRTAIYAVDKYFSLLSGLLSKIVTKKHFTYRYRHEMYNLLRNHYAEISKRNKNSILRIINGLNGRPGSIDDTSNSKRIAFEKLNWLHAIKGLGDSRVDNLYEANLQITGMPPDHPEYSSFSDGVWVGETSPYTAEELLSRDVTGLADVLTSFRESGGWRMPTRRGLAQSLRKALVLSPQYFEGHLDKFRAVDFDYVDELLAGYEDLWRGKKYGNWDELLNFCYSLVSTRGFWNPDKTPAEQGLRATNSWVVRQIANLIVAGTASDENAFDPALLPQARLLIECILEHQDSEDFDRTDDALEVAINSARGRSIEALINYALRRCRLANETGNKADHTNVWSLDLQPMFDNEIERIKTGNYEFVALFGRHISNFFYLNSGWTIEQLPKIFDKSDPKTWTSAMCGYAYNNIVYSAVYSFLEKNSHIRDALNTDGLAKGTRGKLIQNVLVTYFQGGEDISSESGILNWLISRQNAEEIGDITWFVWTLRDAEKRPDKEKLFGLWKTISDNADLVSDKGKKTLSRLALWSVFVDELDAQTIGLLKKLAPFADVAHNAHILVEALSRLVDVYPREVAEIYWLFADSCTPTYPQEEIEHILSKLMEADISIRDTVNDIFDAYARSGVEFPAKIKARYMIGN